MSSIKRVQRKEYPLEELSAFPYAQTNERSNRPGLVVAGSTARRLDYEVCYRQTLLVAVRLAGITGIKRSKDIMKGPEPICPVYLNR